jgi:uncharacterized membrane protein YgcG
VPGAGFVCDLDAPLLWLPSDDAFTLRDACAGVHIFGGIGSGKTSGSGRMLAGAYLRAGMGGLITVIKPEEIDLFRRYAAEHGRSQSLLLFDENEGFNFLEYELARQGIEGIGTVTECLLRVIEAAKKASPTASSRGGDEFWESSTRMLLRYSLLPLYAAGGSLSIADIIRFISTAPARLEEVRDSKWQDRSFMYGVLNAAAHHPKVAMSRETLKNTLEFWEERWPAIPEKTRGNIVITVAAVLDRFLHGRLQRMFCGRTTLVPELTFHGVIIVLAMPTLTFNEDGIIAQQLFKYMWQRAVLSRNGLAEKHRERPVFLWSDEAQETVSSYDGEFLGLCRGSKCCITYLTQSLPAYFSKIGGDNPRDAATNLVGKFKTNIFHSNACAETNEYASRVLGKVVKRRGNYSAGEGQTYSSGMSQGRSEQSGTSNNHGSSYSHAPGGVSTGSSSGGGSNSGTGSNWGVNQSRGTSSNVSSGYSESMEYAIEPGEFARGFLKTGGRDNAYLVTGVWFQSGRVFKSGGNYMLGIFAQ